MKRAILVLISVFLQFAVANSLGKVDSAKERCHRNCLIGNETEMDDKILCVLSNITDCNKLCKQIEQLLSNENYKLNDNVDFKIKNDLANKTYSECSMVNPNYTFNRNAVYHSDLFYYIVGIKLKVNKNKTICTKEPKTDFLKQHEQKIKIGVIVLFVGFAFICFSMIKCKKKKPKNSLTTIYKNNNEFLNSTKESTFSTSAVTIDSSFSSS